MRVKAAVILATAGAVTTATTLVELSFSACLVRVADSVSLADQPVSISVETMKGDRVTVSSFAAGLADGMGATWAGRWPTESVNKMAAVVSRRGRGWPP